jgi:heme o synthase
LWPATLAPWLLGIAGGLYGTFAVVLSAVFTGLAIQVSRDESDHSARRMFAFSLLYLFLIFSALLIDPAGGAWH